MDYRMKKIIKKFDKETRTFKKIEIDASEIIKQHKSLTEKFKQKIFIDDIDLKIITSVNKFIENFDYKFFDKYKDDINVKLFRDKLYKISNKIEKFNKVKKSKNNQLIDEAIVEFKIELKGYKSLKESIFPKLKKFKIDKYKEARRYAKIYKKKKIERVSRFGHENYGSVLSVSKSRRNSF